MLLEFFDDLAEAIGSPQIFKQYHFPPHNRSTHYEYGEEYRKNEILVSIPQNIKDLYKPFEYCQSAQGLIKKEDIILREIPVIVIPSIFVIIIIVELIRLIRKQSLRTG